MTVLLTVVAGLIYALLLLCRTCTRRSLLSLKIAAWTLTLLIPMINSVIIGLNAVDVKKAVDVKNAVGVKEVEVIIFANFL